MDFLLAVLVIGIIIIVLFFMLKDITPIDNGLKPINKEKTTRLNSNKVRKNNSQPVIYVPDEKLVTFARTQLIGGSRFIETYDVELKALHNNTSFMKEISRLRIKYNGCEITDTRNVNKDIADYFYYNKFNETYLQVQSITQKVKIYGKQASAHISIYYAMFLYD